MPDPIGAPSPPDWTCTNPGPVHTCTFPEASLPDGVGGGQLDPTNSIVLQFGVVVPKVEQEQADACEVTNQAMITQAPGGSPMNINPADDTSALIHSATPGPNCPPVDRHSDLSIPSVVSAASRTIGRSPKGLPERARFSWPRQAKARRNN